MANFAAAQWIEYCTKKAVPIMEIPFRGACRFFVSLFFHLFFPDDLFLFLFCTVTKLINGL